MADRNPWHIDCGKIRLCNLSMKTCVIGTKHYETSEAASSALEKLNSFKKSSGSSKKPLDCSASSETKDARIQELDWLVDFKGITFSEMIELKALIQDKAWRAKLGSFVR